LQALPWLQRAPADFGARLAAVKAQTENRGSALARLANHSLSASQLSRLANLVVESARREIDLTPLVPFKLGLLSNATVDLLGPALIGAALRHGIALQVTIAPYDQAIQQALDPDSELNRAKLDAVLALLDHRAYPFAQAALGDGAATETAVAAAVGLLAQIRAGVRAGSGAPLIVQTLADLPESLFGSFDPLVDGTHARLFHAFNARLLEMVREGQDYLLDVARIAATVGLENWHDPQHWNMYKLPFAQSLVPLLADHVGRMLGAIRGRSRKCLVLDLDNTVWGGVIGDDGLDGIVIGQGDANGESFLAVQSTALRLRERGIVLCVSSKNEEAICRQALREHPDMLLREDHIAVLQANWSDKASNLEAIATTLNIGLDALVLLDDNPAERAQVRESLPQVAVPELPAEPALYARTLLAAGYFEAVGFAQEDLQRSEQYRLNAQRAQLQAGARDLSSYLQSLEMRIAFAPFDSLGRARIAQLINKSNQFNLTSRRYSEAEVATVQNDSDAITLQVRLSDTFGDNGMICVAICRAARDGDWDIDTWLMSCRVLGRCVEQAVLNRLVELVASKGGRRLVGRFIPSGRNELVRDHYRKLGFEPLADENGATVWALDVRRYRPVDVPMEAARVPQASLAD
jgi:FkbH-like protein